MRAQALNAQRPNTNQANQPAQLLTTNRLLTATPQNNPARSGITFAGRPHLTLGGVGRNLATAIDLLGHRPTFITALADDKLGSFALAELRRHSALGQRLQVNWWRPANEPASSCFALVLVDSNDGQCEYVIANLDAVAAIKSRQLELTAGEAIKRAPLLVMDANLAADTLDFLVRFCHQHRVPIFIEPTDVVALPRLAQCLAELQRQQLLSQLLCLSPNLLELQHLVQIFRGEQVAPSASELSLEQAEQMARELMQDHLGQLKCLLVTMDKRGALLAVRGTTTTTANLELMKVASDPQVQVKHFATPQTIERPVSGSGAGDSFAAGFISGLLRNHQLDRCMARGFAAAALTLQDRDTISQELKRLALDPK